MDAIEAIRQFNRGREPERLALKYQRMRASPFAFFRGSCHLFYAQLPAALQAGALQHAPPAWACGDLHLENFGSYKGDDRQVYFDINDFDEALLAPAHWDVLRFLCSLYLGLPSEAEDLSTHFLAVYAKALLKGEALGLDRDSASGPVQVLLKSLRDRKRADFLDQRCSRDGKKGLRRIKVGGNKPKALPASAAQRAQLLPLMAEFAQAQPRPEFFEVLDVARRVAGTGSLGLERYVILVAGKGSPDGNYLLDLKRVQASCLQAHVALAQPAWSSQAQRVLSLQRRLQAKPMAFLHAMELGGQPFVLRALQPAEDRVRLEAPSLSSHEARALIESMAQLLAWAQLRAAGIQGAADASQLADFGRARADWQPALMEAVAFCTAQARRDATAFDTAFDAGFFADVRSV